MNRLNFNDPLHIIWRKGTMDDPYVDKTDTRKIVNGLLVLDEIPDEFSRVTVEGFREIRKGTPQEGEFIVNYQNGLVTFHPAHEGQTVTAIYKGRGIILYPAERIYSHNKETDVLINLQAIIDNTQAGIDALSQIVPKLQEVDQKIAETEALKQDTIQAAEEATTAAANATAKIGEMDAKLDEADSAILAANTATADAIVASQVATQAKEEAESAATAALTAAAGADEAADRADLAAQEADAAKEAAIQATQDTIAATNAANTATTEANQARDAANAAAVNADDKATLAEAAAATANTAASAANDAAANANANADYAQLQGDYALEKGNFANEQGSYAKQQGDYAKAQGDVVQGAVSAIVHLGEYDPSTSYVKNNMVRYNGSTYICIADCVGIEPTNTDYWELAAIKGQDGMGDVLSVNDKTGHVILTKDDLGLGNVDNTSDMDKPISHAVQAALDDVQAALSNKVDNSRVLTDVPAGVTYVHPSPTAPSNTDMLWLDTSVSPRRLKYWNGSTWVAINTYA